MRGLYQRYHMMIRLSASVLAIGLAISAAGPARSAEIYSADYSVSLLGLRLAVSHFVTTVDKSEFTAKGNLSTAGLMRVFDRTDGETAVSGHIDGQGVAPASYRVDYRYGKKATAVRIDFAHGDVVRAERTPPQKKKGDWIDVTPGDLKSVADPLSAMLIKAPDARSVCDRTLRIFDGSTRVDLKLAFAGWQNFSTDGFKGTATSCRVTFIPVSGYRRGVFAMDYLSREKDMRVAFASLGNSDIYAPVFARVGTKLGDVTVYATKFQMGAADGK